MKSIFIGILLSVVSLSSLADDAIARINQAIANDHFETRVEQREGAYKLLAEVSAGEKPKSKIADAITALKHAGHFDATLKKELELSPVYIRADQSALHFAVLNDDPLGVCHLVKEDYDRSATDPKGRRVMDMLQFNLGSSNWEQTRSALLEDTITGTFVKCGSKYSFPDDYLKESEHFVGKMERVNVGYFTRLPPNYRDQPASNGTYMTIKCPIGHHICYLKGCFHGTAEVQGGVSRRFEFTPTGGLNPFVPTYGGRSGDIFQSCIVLSYPPVSMELVEFERDPFGDQRISDTQYIYSDPSEGNHYLHVLSIPSTDSLNVVELRLMCDNIDPEDRRLNYGQSVACSYPEFKCYIDGDSRSYEFTDTHARAWSRQRMETIVIDSQKIEDGIDHKWDSRDLSCMVKSDRPFSAKYTVK